MATGTFNLGDFSIEDDSNGDLIVKDPSGATVATWDDTNNQWDFPEVSVDGATVGATTDIGDGSRPLISNQHQTVNVPADYPTIQAAVDACPIILRHVYKIFVDPGTYNEDVAIRNVHAGGPSPNNATAEYSGLFLLGDSSTPTNVEVDSVTAIGCSGPATPTINGIHILDANPWDDEKSGITFQNVGFGQFISSSFGGDNTQRAVTAYASRVYSRDIDLGSSVRTQGYTSKLQADVTLDGGPITGTVSGDVMWVQDGRISFDSTEVTATGGGEYVNADRGMAFDIATGQLYGVDGLPTIGDVVVDASNLVDQSGASFTFKGFLSNSGVLTELDGSYNWSIEAWDRDSSGVFFKGTYGSSGVTTTVHDMVDADSNGFNLSVNGSGNLEVTANPSMSSSFTGVCVATIVQ